EPVLIFVGRLTAVKKLHLLIQALKKALDNTQLRSFNLVIVGSGPEQERLLQLVSKLNLNDHVWFYGACYEEEKLARLLYQADICVSPGNVGLTALHALSYGTPIISHNNFSKQMPEFEVIQPEVTGAFFTERDASSLSNTINSWLERYGQKTPDLRENCYKVIHERYNPFFQIKVLKAALLD
ncbi:MAG: glycosyltransferase family 4 protein, partial [Mameliella sp.]|nr:glycosyltransferase family 4 protein [Phaeodactylibacter sp.]